MAGAKLASALSVPSGPSPRHFWANTLTTQRNGGAGFAAGSSSEQQDGLCDVAQQSAFAFRAATAGRTCGGGLMPRASAQASFCSSVKQQQSPAQPCSDVEHPHEWFWHGNGTGAPASRLGRREQRRAGRGDELREHDHDRQHMARSEGQK